MMELTECRINLPDFSGKRQCNSDLVDRISDLPDPILSVILSFLPTKEAVSTILLSKRWKFVWRTVHNLDFDQEGEDKQTDLKFVQFVNGVLQHHDGAALNMFTLALEYDINISASLTKSWIETAINKNVRELYLLGIEPCRLPRSVFRCESLRSLKLAGWTFVPHTLVFHLPRLETLEFDEVTFKSEAAFEKLICGCPMLKHLKLELRNEDLNCVISSSSLKRLEIDFYCNNRLKLNASSLEYLMLRGDLIEIFVEKNLCSLVEAGINIYNIWKDDDGISYNSIAEAIRAFDSAKVLTLSNNAFPALQCAKIAQSTKFKRLVKLQLDACRSLLDCRTLQDFICNSDNLEVLIIRQARSDLDELSDHHSKWNPVVEVPGCLSNNLKEVRLRYRKCAEVEYEMIKFMLEHGSALEVVEIYCDEDISDVAVEMFKVAQKILKFPRKSTVCKVGISAGGSHGD